MTKGQSLSIGLTATCTDDSITLHADREIYNVWRMLPGSVWGEPIIQRLIGMEFVDRNITTGVAYEYKVRHIYGAVGYTLAGSKIPLVDQRGKLILIVESAHALTLNKEISQFVRDLVSDGYEVLVRRVLKTNTPEYVKGVIKLEYEADPANVKTVILFGAVPVRLSGPVNYDGHGPVMVAADTFYGEFEGDWSNNPSIIPGKMAVAVGRIDFSELTNFKNKPNNPRSELDLLQQYLNRNHAFRTGQWPVTPRGAVRDWWPDGDFSSNGWRNMPQLCRDGIGEIPDGKFFAMASDFDYLLAFACGGGQLTSMAGVGGSDDFALNDIQVPFVMLLGSAMLGRWDVESGFVRSCLASGDEKTGCLVAFGAGAPHVFLHRMGLGGTIGESFLLSENNFTIYPPTGNAEHGLYTPAESTDIPPCAGRVHQALFGDPTLTLMPVKPVTNLAGIKLSDGALGLSWLQPADSVGCHVYRSANANGPFQRLTQMMLETPGFIDHQYFQGLNYMVRAVRLVTTPSGSYYAASCGAMWSDSQTHPTPPDPGIPMSKAKFIEADLTTKGNWLDKYGIDGMAIALGVREDPSYTSPTFPTDTYLWSDYSDDVRALQRVLKPRIAAVWVADIGFEVEIKSDAMPHRLALYFLDWDDLKRSQRIEILDGATGAVINTQNVMNFAGGVWLVWEYAGSIKLRLTKLAGPNCVLSGIFLSPAGETPAPVPTPKMRTLEIQSSSNATGPWTVMGTVDVEATGEKIFYRLGIL